MPKKLEKDSALLLLTTSKKLLMKVVMTNQKEYNELNINHNTIPFSNALKMIIQKKDFTSITNQV